MNRTQRVQEGGREAKGHAAREFIPSLTRISCLLLFSCLFSTAQADLRLVKTLSGSLSSKSVVHNGHGLFFAQNMMYRHTVDVFDREMRHLKTISDTVTARQLGLPGRGKFQGSPVECAFTSDGKFAWVSNYQMYGKGYTHPGNDKWDGSPCDTSFLYCIDTEKLKIVRTVSVGSVPKYVAVTPDNRTVLVSNWASYDLSVVDAQVGKETRRIKLGRFPRGIVVEPRGTTAYVAIMGSSDIAVVNLQSFEVSWLRGVGSSPRHLCLGHDGQTLYATLNGEGTVAKINTRTGKVAKKVSTGKAPRSMAISGDGKWLYVVNYFSNTMSKVRTRDMVAVETVKTGSKPIGITVDNQTHRVWVACYSGIIQVFQD